MNVTVIENRIYNFSIDIMDFVRTLQKEEQHDNEQLRLLVKSAGNLGATFLNLSSREHSRVYLNRLAICADEAKESLRLLQEIRCSSYFDNSLADFIIEIAEISKVVSDIQEKAVFEQQEKISVLS